jgi:hypothetical protein
VDVLEGARPRIAVPARVSVRAGELVAFEVGVEGGGPSVALEGRGPAGSTFASSPRRGRFVWMPPRGARGSFVATFAAVQGPGRVDQDVEIVIEEAGNVPPLLEDPGVVTVVRGESAEVRLVATDTDGDALTFSAKKLPEGVTLDRTTGLVRCSPEHGAATGDLELAVSVSDGRAEDQVKLRFVVRNRTIDTPPTSGFGILAAARAFRPRVRREALDALVASELSTDVKLLEIVRLLRDGDPAVAEHALEIIGSEDLAEAVNARVNLLLLELEDDAWQFTDSAGVRSFLKNLVARPATGEARSAAKRIEKDLAEIERYNEKRGAR